MSDILNIGKSIARLMTKARGGRHYDFISSAAILVRGNAIAQLVLLGTVPVLTRLYEPRVFGVFALFSALIAIIARMGSLCYERAILLPKEHDAAFQVVVLSVLVLSVTFILTACIVIPFRQSISASLGSPDLRDWLFLVPVGVGLVGLARILRNWALRHKQFDLMSRACVLEVLFSASIKILFGFFLGSWVGGLVLGMFAGALVAVMIFLLVHLRDVSGTIKSKINYPELLNTAKAYKSFPVYATWNALMNILSVYVVLFFISVFFGPVAVGLYNLSYKIMQQPVQMVSQAVANVYFQKSAEQVSDGRSGLYGFKKTILVLFSSGIIPFLLFVLYGQDIFGFVFGPQWENAGHYAQILSPWFFIILISGPVNIVFEVYQRQKIKLIFNGLTLISSVAVICLAYWLTGSIEVVLAAFTVVNVIMGLALLITSLKVISGSSY